MTLPAEGARAAAAESAAVGAGEAVIAGGVMAGVWREVSGAMSTGATTVCAVPCERAPIQTPAPPTASAPIPRTRKRGARVADLPGDVLPHDACVFACLDAGGGTDPSGHWKLLDEIPAA